MSDTVELLPCQFCKNPMEFWGDDMIRHAEPTDQACPIRLMAFTNIAAWNTRAPSPDATLLAAEMQRRAEGQIRETIGEAHFFGDKHGIEVLQRALANVEALELPTSALAAAMQVPEVRALVEAAERMRDYVTKGMMDRSGPVVRQMDAALAQLEGKA